MGKTIKEIADLAGVSRGTVDRVIHNRYGVKPEIRDKVNKILTEVNYMPNKVAQALKHSENPKTFGLVRNDMTNPFWDRVMEGFHSAAKALEPNGVKLIPKDMQEITPAEQLRCIEELLDGDEKISGLFLAGLEDISLSDRINEIASEIPVIAYNTDIACSNRLCFVGQNHYAAGLTAGRMMAMLLGEEGEVISYMGPGKTASHLKRFMGFCESMQALKPEIVICKPRMDKKIDYTYDEMAYDYVEKALKNPACKAIYTTGEGEVGAARALRDSGRYMEVKMVCYDLLPEIVRAMEDDVVDVTIGQEEFQQGYLPVNLMYEYLTFGTKPPHRRIYTDINIRIRENIHAGKTESRMDRWESV